MAAETRTARRLPRLFGATDIGNRGTVRYIEEWLTEDDCANAWDPTRSSTWSRSWKTRRSLHGSSSRLRMQTRGLDFVEEVRASKGVTRARRRRGGIR